MVGTKRKYSMEIKFITHSECSEDLLYNICTLKKQHWDYPVAEQIRWFNDNLSGNDIHVCIFDGENLIAYTTLVNIKYHIEDNAELDGLGIGSVCVDTNYLNKKYGFFVVQIVSAFIRQKGLVGILLCKDELVSFYEKNNWIKFTGELKVPGLNKSCNILATEAILSNVITLNKSF
jgi:hypothetical protein